MWLRAWGDTNAAGEGKSDSAHIGLNGNLDGAAAMDQFPAAWTWSNSRRGPGTATITIATPGMQTVNVWMREDGLELDKLILKRRTNPSIETDEPVGFGPG